MYCLRDILYILASRFPTWQIFGAKTQIQRIAIFGQLFGEQVKERFATALFSLSIRFILFSNYYQFHSSLAILDNRLLLKWPIKFKKDLFLFATFLPNDILKSIIWLWFLEMFYNKSLLLFCPQIELHDASPNCVIDISNQCVLSWS